MGNPFLSCLRYLWHTCPFGKARDSEVRCTFVSVILRAVSVATPVEQNAYDYAMFVRLVSSHCVVVL